jgi:hypothetical protein
VRVEETDVLTRRDLLHAIKNVGDTPATDHVIKWNSPGMLKK